MSFLWPEFLWLLLAVPALVGAYIWILRRGKQALRYASLAVVKEAITPGMRIRRHIPPLLILLSLVALILAIARPTALVTLPTEQRLIVMAIDVSLSMRATDVEPNRLAAAKVAAKSFIEELPRDARAAVVSFAGTASVVQAPTRSREDLAAAVDRLELQRHTAIGSAIIVSLATVFPDRGIDLESVLFGSDFARGKGRGGSPEAKAKQAPVAKGAAPKKDFAPVAPGSYPSAAIVLLTDGRRTTGPHPLDAARMAADHGVRVFTVGFGSAAGSAVNTMDWMSVYMRFDEETLKGIADITRAEYYHASSAEELKKVYSALNTKLALERAQTEITALITAAAALLALAAGVFSLLWFSRVA